VYQRLGASPGANNKLTIKVPTNWTLWRHIYRV